MTKLRERMLQDMQLRGFSERTQECYVRSVRQLAEHYDKSPDQITEEEELRDYFLHIKNVKKWNPDGHRIGVNLSTNLAPELQLGSTIVQETLFRCSKSARRN